MSAPEQQELVQRGAVTAVRVHQETGRESRIYELEVSDGVQTWRDSLWSVTTLLKVIDRPALQHWAAKETAKAAFENRAYLEQDVERHGLEEAVYQLSQARFKKKSRAADIGTAVHALIEAHIKGAELPPTDPTIADEVLPRFEQFQRWEEEYQPTYRFSEATVVHPEHGWAGTLDFVAEIGRNGDGLVDIKNTNPNTRNGKPGVYMEAALQVAAYAHATEVVAARGAWVEPVPMTPVGWGAVLWLYPGRRAFVAVDIDDATYTAFRIASQLYRYVDGPGKKAVRGELTPAAMGILPTPAEQAAAIERAEIMGPIISEAQRKRMLAIGAENGMDHAAVKALVGKMTGANSTTQVPLASYDAVVARILEGDPAAAA